MRTFWLCVCNNLLTRAIFQLAKVGDPLHLVAAVGSVVSRSAARSTLEVTNR